MSHKRAKILCACCHQPGENHGRGLIKTCYDRHRENHTLDQFPLQPRNPWLPTGPWGRQTLARYEELRAQHVSREWICWELSLTERSIQRYEAARKHFAQQGADQRERTPA